MLRGSLVPTAFLLMIPPLSCTMRLLWAALSPWQTGPRAWFAQAPSVTLWMMVRTLHPLRRSPCLSYSVGRNTATSSEEQLEWPVQLLEGILAVWQQNEMRKGPKPWISATRASGIVLFPFCTPATRAWQASSLFHSLSGDRISWFFSWFSIPHLNLYSTWKVYYMHVQLALNQLYELTEQFKLCQGNSPCHSTQ